MYHVLEANTEVENNFLKSTTKGESSHLLTLAGKNDACYLGHLEVTGINDLIPCKTL